MPALMYIRPMMLKSVNRPVWFLWAYLSVGIIVYLLCFLTLNRSIFSGPFAIVLYSTGGALNVLILVLMRKHQLPFLALQLVSTFVFLSLTFSLLYWGCGTTENFSASLSRLDAVYFAVGTLSTAGTGNLVATSELAREIQLIQMSIDTVLLVFAVALVLPRFTKER